MARKPSSAGFLNRPSLASLGLTVNAVRVTIEYVYAILDGIDQTLTSQGEGRLAELVELANLSAIIGNLFRGGIAKNSDGRFVANGPHKYPDLLSNDAGYEDIEIKVSLEKNNPKGHLVKPGPHMTIRYVLGDQAGAFSRGKDNRGDVAWIWEVRAGYLTEGHFNFSSTEGDSGKTAVINSDGMRSLDIIYADLDFCAYPSTGPTYKRIADKLKAGPHYVA